ncbi:uncharacterized protein PAE49_021222 isoform 2-T2 [Odontesthes bonariensis]|uniref:uncharacterized protein LOC142368421 isoform X2 n=1 Tax=Odontesthes bonariensis TaxID=219752 RepID=UPI003F582230
MLVVCGKVSRLKMQRVVGMFERQPYMQRIIQCGLLGNNEGLRENQMRSSSSDYQAPLHYYTSARDSSCPPFGKVQVKESDTERKARLLQEAKTNKEKAEKKRLKKQKQKERKEMEKKKQNPETNEEGKDDAQRSKTEESKPGNDKKRDGTNSSVKLSAAAKDTDSDSSDLESSEEDADTKNDSTDSEELDMTSTFVSKAALIARRKLEEKSNAERKEKKKIPDKGRKNVPNKSKEDQEVEKEAQKKDSVAPSSLSFEDNVKISTELANIGNNFASDGDYNMAVKYFTNAIKYNPTEYKLFGNRSFCFEKLREYDKALTDAELSLGICPGWVKGLFRRGRALAGLKRYEEAARAFREVLKLESSYAEAAQELMRVQIFQLMQYGFTSEESSNALIIHGTIEKAIDVLFKLHQRQPGAVLNGTLPPAQVANVTGVSPILSANTNPAIVDFAESHNAPKNPLMNKPLGSVQNIANVQSQSKPFLMKMNYGDNRPSLELFPVWVGNLNNPVTDATVTDLFTKVGVVYSVKVLHYKRCAFVNFTKKEDCDEAIRRFHGWDLNGNKIAVRYPDRIPPGMGISRSALRADDLQDENLRQNAAGSQRPFRPYKPVPDHRDDY